MRNNGYAWLSDLNDVIMQGMSLEIRTVLLAQFKVRIVGIPTSSSTSSRTMEVESVTHALLWIASRRDSRTTHKITLTESMSLLKKKKEKKSKVEWEAQTEMSQ